MFYFLKEVLHFILDPPLGYDVHLTFSAVKARHEYTRYIPSNTES